MRPPVPHRNDGWSDVPMTVGSLFAGIGGFDLGFERAGFEIRWQVEIDPFCRGYGVLDRISQRRFSWSLAAAR